MKLSPYLLYIQFLEKFLSIIQDPEQVNMAIFYGGALRSQNLNQHIPNLSHTATYLPLSSTQLAGLIHEKTGNFMQRSALVDKLHFSFDACRVNEAAKHAGLSPLYNNDTQRLIFVACFQEACNQTNEQDTNLPKLRANIINLMEPLGHEQFSKINHLMQNFALEALALSKAHPITFENKRLSQKSIRDIQQAIDHLKLSAHIVNETNSFEIDDTLLTEEPVTFNTRKETAQRIADLDQLIACLSIDSHDLHPDALREHQAKLFLLRYQYCILHQTERKGWTPNFQKNKHDTIPTDILKHLDYIERAHNNEITYTQALCESRTISRAYLDSWTRRAYAWFFNDQNTSLFYHRCLSQLEESILQTVETNPTDVSEAASVLVNLSFIKATNHTGSILDEAIEHLRACPSQAKTGDGQQKS